ncbi:NAD(P)/FAD-dependent oxidoreductase [Pedobacter montanisoli]|uniref:FAD-binding oxidoreductase n=1 Tax=Pedobacter montanisoli TaxID=2923277 RepID=A0ABS9ZSZ9_9SPHI|nr:FAD-dependent oxidoreductase [Pedobacter montanisoli]MCJ0741730.1 FAD-binding oxidoreductase [Pedobacter montanisoli]
MNYNFSYWEKTSFFSADIIIVGSGIVGLTAAIALKQHNPKLNVLVLERGFLPSGASTKNAGFACFGSLSELIEQEKTSGTDGLHALIQRRWNGLQKLRQLLGDKHIDFNGYGGFELFRKEDEELTNLCVSKISHFNALIEDIVGKHAFSEAHEKIDYFGFNHISSLIENQFEGQINTGKMMRALINKVAASGVQILNSCEVEGFEKGSDQRIHIKTQQGIFICKKLIFANNAFISSFFKDLDVKPGRGQVIVTKPIPSLKVKGTFHYDKGYYYFRNIDHRILFGGGRNLDFKTEETTIFGHTEKILQALSAILKDIILPDTAFEIDYNWSGIMAFGNQLEPIIKEVEPDVFCAVRCNGMGVAMGSQTGQDVADLVLSTF